jgi:ornithine carbamoyltransferase
MEPSAAEREGGTAVPTPAGTDPAVEQPWTIGSTDLQMRHLISIAELARPDVDRVFHLARKLKDGWQPRFDGLSCIYSFEGNSLRTRATFLKALASLGLVAIELPNLLKTGESEHHLAGYLDQWCDLYVVRDSDHAAIEALARASRRPVINAMSSNGHPCEVLGDAFFLREQFGGLHRLKLCIVGPPTNVLRSWVELAELLALSYVWVTPEPLLGVGGTRVVRSLTEGLQGADIVLTDRWPDGSFDPEYRITRERLGSASGDVVVIPCPPFDTTREVSEDVIRSKHFAGYVQKRDLYTVQQAIVVMLLSENSAAATPPNESCAPDS